MRILFVLKQKKNVETFIETIRALIDRGHAVALAVQEHSDTREDQYRGAIESPLFSVVRCPAHRADGWADAAWLLRSLRDCVHYQQPAMKGARKLQARSVQKVREELRIPADNDAVAEALRELPSSQIDRLDAVFALAERQLPVDPVFETFLKEQRPDLLLISPLVHFGSAQADFVAAARAIGIPVGMLLYSWDNLSTKGCLHRVPDWMFVWNERQRAEARALHDFPEDRVIVTGAPRFDSFFALSLRLDREAFHQPLGLDPARPTIFYVCSSLLVSAAELSFVRRWLAAIRASAAPLGDANVIVRPHPDIDLLNADYPFDEITWTSVRGARGYVARPFDDPGAIVLKTTDRARQGFHDCLFHSAAVVGLNTSAELEAAIVGRPVYTVIAGEDSADGQHSTLHFHYLLEQHGGCVRSAGDLTEHTSQLQHELAHPQSSETIRRFAAEFLRPHGIDRPVAPVLAEAIERTAVSQEAAPTRDAPRAIPAESLAPPALSAPGATAGSQLVPLTFAKYGYQLQVHASPASHSDAFRPEKGALEWLHRDISVGDVIYDVDCGVGAYAILAAKYQGAVAIAFEPGYAAFRALCDNVRLNGCDGSVMPISLALGDFEGMGELKYPAAHAGWQRHSLKPARWRVTRSVAAEKSVKLPAYAMRLDQVVARYELPMPHHIRLGNHATAERALDGAQELLQSSGLKTIVFALPQEKDENLTARLATLKWHVTRRTPMKRGYTHVVLSRLATAADVSAR